MKTESLRDTYHFGRSAGAWDTYSMCRYQDHAEGMLQNSQILLFFSNCETTV